MADTQKFDCSEHGTKYGYCEECLFPKDAPPVAVPAPTDDKPCDCTNRYYCQKLQGTLKAGFHCQEDAPPVAELKR